MSRSHRLFVIDDNAANIRLLDAILTSHGYDVSSAPDGPTALAQIGDFDPDAVVLDIQMPQMDGFEVCRRLRADEETAAIPIIMVTSSGPGEKVAALDAGADDFIARPFDQAELLARVRSLLRMKHYRDIALVQTEELAAWNKTLEEQVGERVAEVERLQPLRRFLSTRVAELVISGDNESLLEPHRREIAVLCCDMRGFTAFSVAAEPEDVVGALKEFHGLAGDLISKHGGTVGPFVGDSLMVIFNDPVPCAEPIMKAVSMAVDLRDAVLRFEAAWRERGHTLSAGIGVTFGFATLGVMGFAERSDYMAVGPVVNLASRLCDAATSGEILVSQRVATMISETAELVDRGGMELRGFPGPQQIFALDALTRPVATPCTGHPGIAVLGSLRIHGPQGEVELRGARERRLLLLLLANRGRALSVERLAEELADGAPSDSAVAVLRVQVSRLRKTLAAAGLDNYLVTRPNGYQLDLPAELVDAARFEQLATAGREAIAQSEADVARRLLRDALALWQGEPYTDAGGAAFAVSEAARLEQSRLVVIEDCLEAELAAGRHREVLGELHALVAEHPLRERLWAAWMLALYRCGRQADALSAYQQMHRQLADELGLDPSPRLVQLHQAILTHDSEVAIPS